MKSDENPLASTDQIGIKVGALSGRGLAKSTLWNLMGFSAPLFVGIFTIPFLIEGLGTERFGILSIVWILIGYFSVFDMGLGRALTKLTADRIATDKALEIPELAWTTLSLVVALGAFGGTMIAVLAGRIVAHVIQMPDYLTSETVVALRIIGATIPFVLASSALFGLLEAFHRFEVTSSVRAILGLTNFLGPLVALRFTTSIDSVTEILALARIATFVVIAILVIRAVPGFQGSPNIRTRHVRTLISFGGWLTVSNLISPIMTYFDRFIIGAVIGVGSIAYYTVPYDVLRKLSIFPVAITRVLFPVLAMEQTRAPMRAVTLFQRSVGLLTAVMVPICLIAVLLAEELLAMWLEATFAEESAPVARLLAVGVMVNSIAWIPYTYIQSLGRPDLPAKIHLVELPLYLWIVWKMLTVYGLQGAAAAWMVRSLLDAFIFYMVAASLDGRLQKTVWSYGVGLILVLLLFVLASVLAETLTARLLIITVTMSVSLAIIIRYCKQCIRWNWPQLVAS
jgi:O-antigen/teichoic acid export membrane protein